MKITVNNAVVVRSEDVAENFDVKIKFGNLTEKAQLRIFASNKDTFLRDALNSQYLSVFETAIESLNTEGSFNFNTLNSIIENLLKEENSEAFWIVNIILKSPDFKPDRDTYKILKNSNHLPFSTWAKNYLK